MIWVVLFFSFFFFFYSFIPVSFFVSSIYPSRYLVGMHSIHTTYIHMVHVSQFFSLSLSVLFLSLTLYLVCSIRYDSTRSWYETSLSIGPLDCGSMYR